MRTGYELDKFRFRNETGKKKKRFSNIVVDEWNSLDMLFMQTLLKTLMDIRPICRWGGNMVIELFFFGNYKV